MTPKSFRIMVVGCGAYFTRCGNKHFMRVNADTTSVEVAPGDWVEGLREATARYVG